MVLTVLFIGTMAEGFGIQPSIVYTAIGFASIAIGGVWSLGLAVEN